MAANIGTRPRRPWIYQQSGRDEGYLLCHNFSAIPSKQKKALKAIESVI